MNEMNLIGILSDKLKFVFGTISVQFDFVNNHSDSDQF